MQINLRKWVALLFTTFIVLLIDQITKTWVVNNLSVGQSVQPIPALAPLFQITRSYNTGAAFGILPDSGSLFLILPIAIIIIMLIYYARTNPPQRLTVLAIGLIVGGALGNLVDRVQYEHVVDFIHYQIPDLISNISNLADHGVVIGALLLIVDSWLRERQEEINQLEVNES